MRGKKAKQIRKAVYGDLSLRIPRRYDNRGLTIINEPMSPRAVYQRVKNEYKRS